MPWLKYPQIVLDSRQHQSKLQIEQQLLYRSVLKIVDRSLEDHNLRDNPEKYSRDYITEVVTSSTTELLLLKAFLIKLIADCTAVATLSLLGLVIIHRSERNTTRYNELIHKQSTNPKHSSLFQLERIYKSASVLINIIINDELCKYEVATAPIQQRAGLHFIIK